MSSSPSFAMSLILSLNAWLVGVERRHAVQVARDHRIELDSIGLTEWDRPFRLGPCHRGDRLGSLEDQGRGGGRGRRLFASCGGRRRGLVRRGGRQVEGLVAHRVAPGVLKG